MTNKAPKQPNADLEELGNQASERLKEILSGVLNPLMNAYHQDLETTRAEVNSVKNLMRSARTDADQRLKQMEEAIDKLHDDTVEQKEVTTAQQALHARDLKGEMTALAAEHEKLRMSLRWRSILLLLTMLSFVLVIVFLLKK